MSLRADLLEFKRKAPGRQLSVSAAQRKTKESGGRVSRTAATRWGEGEFKREARESRALGKLKAYLGSERKRWKRRKRER